MANVYWYGGTGNWSDHTNHWSNTSGGAGGADPHGAAPGIDDNAIFDANSFTGASQTVTIDANSTCLALNWTGATNNPTLKGTAGMYLNFYGDVTFIAAMTITNVNFNFIASGSNNIAFTTNGVTVGGGVSTSATYSGTLTLQDNLTTTVQIIPNAGTINTGNYTVTTASMNKATANVATLTLGSSVINISSAWNYSGSNLTLTPNTATIKLTGTASFTGGGLTTYNEVQLNGTAHTISGSNTIHLLGLKPSAAQTLTFTDGTTQTLGGVYRTGTGTITMQGSGAAGWTLAKQDKLPVELNNLSISRSTVTPYNTWYAVPPCTDGSNNVNWIFKSRPKGGSWFIMR